MTCMNARGARIGPVILAAAIATAGFSGEAFARAHKGRLRVHSAVYDSRAQLGAQGPVRLGAMRYYGGPKSPMWRGPVENEKTVRQPDVSSG